MKNVLDLLGGVTQPQAMVLHKLTERSIYHANAKDIDPEKAEKAAENLPFARMIGIHMAMAKGGEPQRPIQDLASEYLRGTYANLESIDVSYSVTDEIDTDAEAEKVEEAKETYARTGLDALVPVIASEYEAFGGLREAFRLMHSIGLLKIENVIPMGNVADHLVIAPVWFVHSKHNLENQTQENDPLPDHAIKFFSDCVGTKEFAWLYQIYNRRTRPMKQYNGRDGMPLPIVKILEVAKKTFDYVVIATPYHDMASKEWQDPDFLRNIDPFLLGFMKGLPHYFLLARWSGTGLFPLVCDMIADTMDHLSMHKLLLEKFVSNTYWYKGDGGDCLQSNGSSRQDNRVLVPFAEEVLKAYEERRLFEFLRGEEPPEEGDDDDQSEEGARTEA